MDKRKFLSLLLLVFLIEQPAWSCGRSSACQKPAGPPKLVQRSYKSLVLAKQAETIQTQTINQYTKLGYQLESKKKWADAERAFRYVLQVVAMRDGTGSFKSVPALEHLALASKEQNKLDQAISYEKTALLLTQAQPVPNQKAVLNAQLNLAYLFVQKKDYASAEPVLSESVAIYSGQELTPSRSRSATYQMYAGVLRKLHKDSEAAIIAAAVRSNASKSELEKPGESKQAALAQNTEISSLPVQNVSGSSPEIKSEPH